MAYINGLNYQPQQYGAMSAPSISVAGQAPGVSGSPTQQNTNIPAAGVSQVPESVSQNIATHNPFSMMTAMGQSNQSTAIGNYQNMQRANGGQQGWTPWALQNQAAGGYGGIGSQIGDLFLHPMRSIQAGSNYAFGANGSQVMQSQYYRDPITGAIQSTGQAQAVNNPYAAQYDMNNVTGRYINQQLGKGVGMGSNPWQKVNDAANSYYGDITKNFGAGQFDTQNFNRNQAVGNFNQAKQMLSYNAPHNSENQRLVDSGAYGGWAPAPQRQQPNYMGGNGYQ